MVYIFVATLQAKSKNRKQGSHCRKGSHRARKSKLHARQLAGSDLFFSIPVFQPGDMHTAR